MQFEKKKINGYKISIKLPIKSTSILFLSTKNITRILSAPHYSTFFSFSESDYYKLLETIGTHDLLPVSPSTLECP